MSVKNKVTLLLVLALLLAGCAPTPQAPQQQRIQIIEQQERNISTYGYGEVRVKADVARFIVTVQTEKSGLSPALEENEQATQALLDILQKYEIANNDIKLDYLQQEKSGTDSKPYFKLRRNIKVVLRDLTQLEPLFTEIIEVQAYQISEVRFQVSNVVLYEEQAVRLAISDARAKADIMTTELGCEVGEAISLQMETISDFHRENSFFTGRYEDNRILSSDLPYLVSQSRQEISFRYAVQMEFQVK
ncbi:MAG: SIMPL domain-containing protein [Chloroflexi bacterium]|nr:SIMPL domain-containing protein [Chloroflexota bacterium]